MLSGQGLKAATGMKDAGQRPGDGEMVLDLPGQSSAITGSLQVQEEGRRVSCEAA